MWEELSGGREGAAAASSSSAEKHRALILTLESALSFDPHQALAMVFDDYKDMAMRHAHLLLQKGT